MTTIIRRCEYFGLTLTLGNITRSVLAGEDFDARLAQAEKELLEGANENN